MGTFGKADWAAAEELFSSSYPRLAGWVRRLVDDDDTAHEIASEAFTRLLARWSSLENPQSYLYMIATNLVRDHWRKTERERRALRTVTASADSNPVAHPAEDVDVRNLIQDLPQRMRNAFLLHYYAGFGVREVAALLGLAGGHDQGRPVPGPEPAEGHHGGIRWMITRIPATRVSHAKTWTAGCTRGSTRCHPRPARSI